ncbi:TRAP transporter large permease subunit [Aneurinibacillus sp. REN35]|uniref:TRAP transporter large permease subunit n=1 Tax=Aneurinibacillus sp. REN35 TaxID=3237286 RepID=UPI003527F380
MISVLVPILLLFVIVLVPAIPKIGGNIKIGLLAAGGSAALFGGLNFMELVSAAITGIDKLAWVIMLSVFGSIYAETQSRLGTVDATLNGLRRIFGNSPLGLIAAIILTLVLAGSLLGDAIAAATVIGFLVIHSLHELKLKPEQIGMIILLGASLGSLMPPISQGVFLSASLVGIDPGPVVSIAYLTVGGGIIFAIAETARFVRGRRIAEDSISAKELAVAQDIPSNHLAGDTTKSQRYVFVPLAVLIGIVLANSAFGYDIFKEWGVFAALTEKLNAIPIVKGIVFPIVLSIIIATLVSFLFSNVRKEGKAVIKNGLEKVSQTAQIQLCAGFMIGVFYQAGMIDTVKAFAEQLPGSAVSVGGAVATVLVGMLTGSQTAAQTIIITFLGPALTHLGVDPIKVALGASHIAAAGQNMPPVGLTAFVVCGLIGGIINQKVDPVKVMLLALPNSLYFLIVGLIAWMM